jgi:hypothetical protein
MSKYSVQRKSDRKILKKNISYKRAYALVKELEAKYPDDEFWVVNDG